MRTVGEILRTRRQELGLTLSEIEGATKIKISPLEDIENNRFEKFSSEVACRGFIKNYAEFLGLTPGPILAIFKRDYVAKKIGKPSFIDSSFRWTPKLTMIFSAGIALLLIVIYLIWQYLSLVRTPYR